MLVEVSERMELSQRQDMMWVDHVAKYYLGILYSGIFLENTYENAKERWVKY